MPAPLFGHNLNALISTVDLTKQIDCTILLLQRLILLPVFCLCRGRLKDSFLGLKCLFIYFFNFKSSFLLVTVLIYLSYFDKTKFIFFFW